MIYHSDALQQLINRDPAFAAKVLHWESCGTLVRMILLRIRLATPRPAPKAPPCP